MKPTTSPNQSNRKHKLIRATALAAAIVFGSATTFMAVASSAQAVAMHAGDHDSMMMGMHGHSPEEIAKMMPEEYALGDKALYLQSIKTNLPAYSPDGKFSKEGAETALHVLKAFDPGVQKAAIDLSKTYTDKFVDAANAGH